MAERPPRGEERALWRSAMRGVAPLQRSSAPAAAAAPPETAPESPPRARVPRAMAPPLRARLPDLAHDAAPGLDRRSAERLRRGALPIEARLDLHGMTQQEAHGALAEFLARATQQGRRCVLVITGKGGPGRGGVLREAVPRWLNEAPNRARLLAFAAAQPRDGGMGALYLLLRRRR
jgi:DNA-nicking Smr family endonuclease